MRTKPESSVPLTALTKEELKASDKALKAQRRLSSTIVKRLKEMIAADKIEMKLSEEPLNHLSERLEYARHNKASLHDSIESSLLELLKEVSDTDDINKEELLLMHCPD